MIGKTVSNFKVVEKLGEGGMGVVYRATDARLKRPVALKFLPLHYTSSADAVERFEREAQSAAALNHPNIITIYEIGEFEGQIYIAMEYVDGHELRELIGPMLPLPRVLEIAVQIADGLHGAHDAGIVHRDIKPENILVTDKGRVKILDFGLAKLHGVTRITQESSTVGTLHYMSPEQTRGEDVDARSDIFSFGAVLYEMITGAAAFPGDNATSVALAITQTVPQPIPRFNRDAGGELERIVMKCLEKNPAERYQSINEALVDLRKVAGISAVATPMPGTTQQHPVAGAASTGLGGRPFGKWMRTLTPLVVAIGVVAVWMTMRGGSPETLRGPETASRPPQTSIPAAPSQTAASGKKMIAVLPFQNLGNAGDEFFADGVTEEITSRLAAVRGLGVISRTSAMQYKGTSKSLQEIGNELGVDFVLEGTVRWSKSGDADRVRITPQLIDVADDTNLWSDRYDRTLDDIFAVQSEIAQSIIRELGVSLLEGEHEQVDERPTENMQAYQAYLRGADMWRNTDYAEDELLQMVEVFDEAVRLDPGFLPALEHLARVHAGMAHFGYDRSEQRMALAKGYAQRCLEVDPESYTGYQAMGTYYYWCRKDYDKALETLDRATELRPSDPEIITTRAYVLRRMGRFREAIADMEEAIRLDPRDMNNIQETGDTYMCLRDFDAARRYFRQACKIAPNNPLPYYYLVMLAVNEGDLEAAEEAMQQMPEDDALYPETEFWVSYMKRDIERVTKLMHAGRSAFIAPTIFTPYESFMARLNWVLGNRDAARAGFETARVRLRQEIERNPRDARFYAELCVVEAALGNREASAAAREKCVASAEPDLYGGPFYDQKFIEASIILGDTDDALARLDAALSKPSEGLHPGSWKLEPLCDPLRDDPRFDAIIEKHWNEKF